MIRSVFISALLFALLTSAPAVGAFGIHNGDHIDIAGDSISELDPNPWNEGGTSWYTNAGGLADQLVAALPAPPTRKIPGVATGNVASCSGAVGAVQATTQASGVAITGFGVAGQTAVAASANFLASMVTRIPAAVVSPIIVNEWAINDGFNIQQSTETIGQFTTAYTSILSQEVAQWPSARIVCLSALGWNEAWTTGPAWDVANGMTTQIGQINSVISSACAAVGGAYVDTYDALLVREVTQNPSKLVGGVELVANCAGGNACHAMNDTKTHVMATAFLAAVPPS